MQLDMTRGSVPGTFLAFLGPVLLGSALQQLYSVVDSMVVGRFVSMEALAAVGATGVLNYFVFGFIFGLANGFAVLVGQRFGAGDHGKMRETVLAGAAQALAVALAVSLLALVFVEDILRLLGTPEDILHLSATYLRITLLATPASLLYNYEAACLRAAGDSRTPLVMLVFSSLFNIAGDLFFVLVVPLGVAGVAAATALSTVLCALGCLLHMFRKGSVFRYGKGEFRFSKRVSLSLAGIGYPSALQNSVSAIGCMILQVLVNGMGTEAVAGYSVGNRIEGVTAMGLSSAVVAMANFTSQNAGAGQFSRIRKGMRVMGALCAAWAVFVLIFTTVFSRELACLFLDPSETAAIRYAAQYMFCTTVLYVPAGFGGLWKSASQGLGSGMVPFATSVQELVVRFLGALVLPMLFGFPGAVLSGSISWTTSAILLFFCYRALMRREERKANLQA